MWIIRDTKTGKYLKSYFNEMWTEDRDNALKFEVKVSQESLNENMVCEEFEHGKV